jgi:hypothetical protein
MLKQLDRRKTEGRRNIDERPELADQPKIADELNNIEHEPLLPAEKQLIAWSLGLGIVLLGLLMWASYTFFPG